MGNAVEQCNCGPARRMLSMHTTSETEASGFPVTVYDVNLNPVEVAYGKEEYINIWNAAPANIGLGTLYGASGLFAFLFIRKTGSIPGFVYGNPLGEIIGGDHRELITDDGEIIITDDGESISTE